MKKADHRNSTFFYILAGGIFTYACAGAIFSSTFIKIGEWRLFFISLLIVAGFCAFFYNKYTFITASAGLLLTVLVVLLYLWSKNFEVEWFARMAAFFRELTDHVRGMTAYRDEYSVLGYGIVLLLACFSAAVIRTGLGFYFISILGFTVIGALTYTGYSVQKIYSIAILLIVLCLFALKLSRSALRRTDASGDTVYALNANGLMLLPLCAILLILASIMPLPRASAGLGIMGNLESNLFRLSEFVQDTFGQKYFTFSTTGFSGGGGRLGGNIVPNDRHVMDVYGPARNKPYLAGAYRDTYTGDRWTASAAGPADNATFVYKNEVWTDITYPGGIYERVKNMFASRVSTPGMSEESVRNIVMSGYVNSARQLTIVNGRSITAMFVPAGSIAAIHRDSAEGPINGVPGMISSAGKINLDISGAVSTQKAMKRESRYTVAYLDSAIYSSTNEEIDELFRAYPMDLSEDELERYLAVPESLPQRVRDLAEEITKNARNPCEKMKALETYLSKYPYTLSPGPVPDGHDFVDWFLFESKQGYCTYYATALAVMARCVGVPTRYAEGFTLPYNLSPGGYYEVTNTQAHAWCEAYFPFDGWVPFEATAPYNYPFYNSGETPTLETITDYSSGDEEMIDQMLDRMQRESRPATSARPSDEADDQTEPEPSGAPAFVFVGVGVALLAAALVFLRYNYCKQNILRLEAAPDKEAAAAYFRRIARLLAANGQGIEPHETALAYARRIDAGRSTGSDDLKMEALADIFARAAYSIEDVTHEERQCMVKCYEQLILQSGSSGIDRASAWIDRYLLGKY